MTEEKYEKLKAKIVEAVPEIMELKFGCSVFIQNFFVSLTIVEDRRGDTWIEEVEQNADFIATVGNHIQYFNENHITEILGREINIQDIIFTVRKTKFPGAVGYQALLSREIELDILKAWDDLLLPLSGQSDETKELLYKIICE